VPTSSRISHEATNHPVRLGERRTRAESSGPPAAVPALHRIAAAAPPQHRLASPTRRARQTATALYLADCLSFDEWRDVGSYISVLHNASAWWIGDWILYGQAEYGRRYRVALEVTNLDYQTLRNYAWVASRFPVSRRRDKVSFQHHAEVAALPEDEQDMWLVRASVHKWTRNELRRRMRAARAALAEQTEEDVTLTISVSSERRRRWVEAATASGIDLADWIPAALDGAAATALTTAVTTLLG
jgi:hypothetical protein